MNGDGKVSGKPTGKAADFVAESERARRTVIFRLQEPPWPRNTVVNRCNYRESMIKKEIPVKIYLEAWMRIAGNVKIIVAALGCAVLCFPTYASDSNDKATGLPLHAGIHVDQEVASGMCGKKAQVYLYDVPNGAVLADYVAWYKANLPGFHYVHKFWDDRPQEMFYSADGSKGVSLTGKPKGPGVFAIAYMRMATNLTLHEMDVYSPDKGSCK